MNNKEIDLVIDFLTQSNYNHNRKLGVTPEKFALLYGEKKVTNILWQSSNLSLRQMP